MGHALPAAPPPLPGEALASWIGRLACLYDTSPQELWCELAGSMPIDFAWSGTGRVIGEELSLPLTCLAGAARLARAILVRTTVTDAFPAAPAQLAAFGERVDIAHTLVFSLFSSRCGARAAALSEVCLGGGLRRHLPCASNAVSRCLGCDNEYWPTCADEYWPTPRCLIC